MRSSTAKILRHVIQKDVAVKDLLSDLSKQLDFQLAIFREDEKVIYGAWNESLVHDFPVKLNGERVAKVLSDSNQAGRIADMVSILLKKEWDKKKIGSEVLSLYREINMIYDFSEQISEKIDARSIAEIALSEAGQIISAKHGLCLMLKTEENIGAVEAIASFGLDQDPADQIADQHTLLSDLIERGSSAIVSGLFLEEFSALSNLSSLMYAPLKVKRSNFGLLMLARTEGEEFTAAELKLLTTIALQSATAIESARLYQRGLREAKEREEAIRRIHEVSTKFVPFEFIKSLGKENLTEVALGDLVQRQVTVVFADIRDYTTLAESMTPQDNFLFINAFNRRMGPIVREHKGFINQYLGDGFMAIFPGGAEDAILASVSMHNALKAYNLVRESRDRSLIKMGIGMQTGNLIMGITGDHERMEAATISDTVNTAARIEGLSKHYGTSILLTEDCLADLPDSADFDFRYLGLVRVKGKKLPLKIFECINGDHGDLQIHKLETIKIFDEAMDQFYGKEFAMAAVAFQGIVKRHRGDVTAKRFLNRAANLITQEVGDDWQGIETMNMK